MMEKQDIHPETETIKSLLSTNRLPGFGLLSFIYLLPPWTASHWQPLDSIVFHYLSLILSAESQVRPLLRLM